MGTDTQKFVIIRADATQQTGYGHLMRCLALAQACKNIGRTPVFLSQCDNSALHSRIKHIGGHFIPIDQIHPNPTDLEKTIQIVKQFQTEWLILDGYHFDLNYQRAIRNTGCHLLVVDDLADAPEYHADILLNQNVYAKKLSYKCNSDAALLLGTSYALLRDEFSNEPDLKNLIPNTGKKILITMGGSDPNNVTLKVIQAIANVTVEELEVVAMVGNNNPFIKLIKKEVQGSRQNIQLITDPSSIVAWMKWADIAISGGGSTCYELAFLGIPNLIIILAENQRMVAPALEAQGSSINLGWHEHVTPKDIALRLTDLVHSPQIRKEMSKHGKNLIDGQGANRIAQWMNKIQMLNLREAQEADSQLIFEWANDPITRSVSFSTSIIPWEIHRIWYSTKLADPYSIIFIALDPSSTPIGMVRYQLDGMESTVSINLDPYQRGKGYGAPILQLSAKRLFQTGAINLIHAYIKPNNIASIHVFTKAGFVEKEMVNFQGNAACHFILNEALL